MDLEKEDVYLLSESESDSFKNATYDNIDDGDDDVEEEFIPVYTNSLSKQERKDSIREIITLAVMILIGLVMIGIILIYLRFLLEPLILSRFLLFLFNPLINILIGKKSIPFIHYCWYCCNCSRLNCRHKRFRLKMPKAIAIIIIMLLIIILFFILGLIIWFSVQEILNDSDKYLERFNDLFDQILDWAESLGYDRDEILDILPDINVSEIAIYVVGLTLSFIPEAILVLLFTLYMLLGYDEKQEKSDVRKTIDKDIRKYILLKIGISFLTAAVITFILFILSVDMFMLFGLLTFLLNFIPSVGSMIAVLLPIPIALLDPDQKWWSITLVIVLPTIVQFCVGNFVEPKLMGNSLEMSPVSVLAVLTFFGSIWGIVGAFLSIPITVVVKEILLGIDHPATIFLGNLIIGKLEFSNDTELEDYESDYKIDFKEDSKDI